MTVDDKHYVRCFEALKDSNLFGNLNHDILHQLLLNMTLEKWSESNFKSGKDLERSRFRFIISGRLKRYQINAETGREHTIYILSKGDVFDILYLLDDNAHEVYWETIDDMELLNIPIAKMRLLIETNPSLNKNILLYLGKRMLFLERAVTDMSLHSTIVRLSKLLLNNINQQSNKLELINNLSNEEIASLIGTTRAVVNRHLQELKKCGAIDINHKHIDIKNIKLLLSIAEENFLFLNKQP